MAWSGKGLGDMCHQGRHLQTVLGADTCLGCQVLRTMDGRRSAQTALWGSTWLGQEEAQATCMIELPFAGWRLMSVWDARCHGRWTAGAARKQLWEAACGWARRRLRPALATLQGKGHKSTANLQRLLSEIVVVEVSKACLRTEWFNLGVAKLPGPSVWEAHGAPSALLA